MAGPTRTQSVTAAASVARRSGQLLGWRAMGESMHPGRGPSPAPTVPATSAAASASCSTGSSTRRNGQVPALEPQRHQRWEEGTCHCLFHPPQRPYSWTLPPSGLQTSASPSELQVSKDQNVGWGVGVCVAGKGLISMFCSGVVWASPSLLSSPPAKRTQIWLLSQGGGEVFFMFRSLKDSFLQPLSPCSSL